ncbi:hypothetical protein PBCV1_a252bL [Paramecium bursaria Chlorella virus 1]|uniref:Uncharacterized protein n=1 Tax=Paramecium bursaria Chlorella virus 1 TaxID=10506 RepID=F8TU07_PBCV1|nr:hypothetical protein PBCV1_a252bL [Paramecium bursaria Chlorella virus 1]AEI70068.1 hypothetical protein [Paramecium bursaria Chlorella virus 1]
MNISKCLYLYTNQDLGQMIMFQSIVTSKLSGNNKRMFSKNHLNLIQLLDV